MTPLEMQRIRKDSYGSHISNRNLTLAVEAWMRDGNPDPFMGIVQCIHLQRWTYFFLIFSAVMTTVFLFCLLQENIVLGVLVAIIGFVSIIGTIHMRYKYLNEFRHIHSFCEAVTHLEMVIGGPISTLEFHVYGLATRMQEYVGRLALNKTPREQKRLWRMYNSLLTISECIHLKLGFKQTEPSMVFTDNYQCSMSYSTKAIHRR